MRYILSIIITLFTLTLSAQELPERGLVRRGNRAYNKGEYKSAIESYDRALQAAPTSFEARYNYANALHKDEQYAKAEELYASINVDSLATDADRADLYYNLGNSQFMQQKYKEALESYKSSIRINYEDQEAKYNYAYTKKLLEDQEQNQDQNQDQNEDQDENEDQQDENQDQNDDQGDQNEDQQDENEDQGDGEQEQKESPPSEGQISPQEQQQMLDAIQAQEDKTQEKLKEEGKGVVVKGRKNW